MPSQQPGAHRQSSFILQKCLDSKWASRKLAAFTGFELLMAGGTLINPALAPLTIPAMKLAAVAYLGAQGITDASREFRSKTAGTAAGQQSHASRGPGGPPAHGSPEAPHASQPPDQPKMRQ